MCAVVIDGILVSEKERKKLAKQQASPKRSGEKSWVGKYVWFLNALELYEGKVIEDRDDGFYIIEARNKNIHKNGEMQMCIVPKSDVRGDYK